ncbi:MAG: type II secretion system protein [Candidatus Margulisiibacteriota bacterium]
MKKGFTLIELVMVIVILGILAATALPRFIDLSSKAKENAAKGTLGSIRAAVAIQYASNAAYGNASMPANITAALFHDGNLPVEPYSNVTTVNLGLTPEAGGTGWMYDSVNGRVWINNSAYSSY